MASRAFGWPDARTLRLFWRGYFDHGNRVPAPAAGDSASIILRLTDSQGKPVTLDHLIVAHTQKIHLLIVEETLSDYLHEHPVPTGTPGEYRFDFKPRFGGIYHL